ncbi:hypothetical protein [Gymnodinialimonas ulvae]|uniref:hypothetical protein n=1 Tax=Gymnodinialimonas ulvae TaxID=3126504 RepID=UPI0030B234C7
MTDRARMTLVAMVAALSMAHPVLAEDPPVTPSEPVVPGLIFGAIDPPVIGRERLIVEVLPQTGVCMHLLVNFGDPCPIIRLPDGTERAAMIVGFHRAGPLTIEVDRLTYDYEGWTYRDYAPPAFEYVGSTEYRQWSREEWGPCPQDLCTLPPARPVHPVYTIPYPEQVQREFIDVELVSDQGVCIAHSLPENEEFDCHEVRLPEGEVIALDIGPHRRFPIGSMLYMERITYAAPHPLFDHDRFEFLPYARPGE